MHPLHGVPRAIGAHVLGGVIILLGAGQGRCPVVSQGKPGLIDGKRPGQHGQHRRAAAQLLAPGKQAKQITDRYRLQRHGILPHMPGGQRQPPGMENKGPCRKHAGPFLICVQIRALNGRNGQRAAMAEGDRQAHALAPVYPRPGQPLLALQAGISKQGADQPIRKQQRQ